MDIFDAPDRMLYIGESSQAAGFPASSSQRSLRLCPAVSQISSAIPHAQSMSALALYHAYSDVDMLLFKGPARPRYPLILRHSSTVLPFPFPLSARSGKTVSSLTSDATARFTLPEPIMFSKPARPRRLIPIPRRKSNRIIIGRACRVANSAMILATVSAGAGLLGICVDAMIIPLERSFKWKGRCLQN